MHECGRHVQFRSKRVCCKTKPFRGIIYYKNSTLAGKCTDKALMFMYIHAHAAFVFLRVMVTFSSYISNACHSLYGVALNEHLRPMRRRKRLRNI